MLEVFIYAAILLIIGTAAYAGLQGAPWVPTRKRDIDHLLSVLPDLNGKKVLDLGCGTGSILFALAQKYPDGIFYGNEVSVGPIVFAVVKKFLGGSKYKNVHFRFENMYTTDVADIDVLLAFILDKPHARIARELGPKLKPDALAVFEAWAPEGFTPRSVHQDKEHFCLDLFAYRGEDFSKKL